MLPIAVGGHHRNWGRVASRAITLLRTAEKTGLTAGLSSALSPWRKPLATHDPGKIVLDLAVAVALGGDCLADVALLREEPGVFGPVASDPTVSRLLSTLAADAPTALRAINTARAAARQVAWAHAGAHAPDHDISAKNPLIIDLDATLVTAHSEKEHAAPTYKKGFGHHPFCAFVDHGHAGTGEPLALALRPGNAGSNTAADHISIIAEALRQLPFPTAGRVGRKVLIRTDGAGGTHEVVEYLTKRALSYSLGFGLTASMVDKLSLIPPTVWTPAYDAEETPRQGAWVAELTGLLDLSGWPAGMRVIVRKERPHPGAQLRFTDTDGLRLTAFITNTRNRQLADLELRHRRRARCEDRIRICKDTGLTNLPLHGFAQNQLWLAVVSLAVELTAWLQMLAFTDHPARRWEPKRLRLRLFFDRWAPRPPRQATPAPALRARPLATPHRDRPHPAQSTPSTRLTSSNPPRRDRTITGTVEPGRPPLLNTPGRTSTPTDRTENQNSTSRPSTRQHIRPAKEASSGEETCPAPSGAATARSRLERHRSC